MDNERSEYVRLIAPIEDRMIRCVWRIVRDSEDADDAFQNALLNIWKRWEQVQRHPNPQALVLRICINSAHDMLRRRAGSAKWLEPGAIPEGIADSSPSPIQGVCSAESSVQVLRAIGQLPKNQAQAVLMHAVEEIPYGDIALAMDCREATVRKHVARARTRLRSLLSHLVAPAPQKEESTHA